MKTGFVTGQGCNYMCSGPLCFHGFEYREKVFVKKGESGRVAYVCQQWGEMIPN